MVLAPYHSYNHTQLIKKLMSIILLVRVILSIALGNNVHIKNKLIVLNYIH